jgi:DNA polymerase-3 subunit alpha
MEKDNNSVNKIIIKFLSNFAHKSLKDKMGSGSDLSLYTERLKSELAQIAEMDCGDKFIIATDIANYAKDNNVVLFGIGGCCSSLLLYLFDVTPIDPVKYGLRFERFADNLHFDFCVDYDKCEGVAEYVKSRYDEPFTLNERQNQQRKCSCTFSQLGLTLYGMC